MQVFLVGGAVRDHLLKLPVTEKDWVVVGATPQTLLQLGFSQVGKDFPVFLHPQTKDEYALARTERKSGLGYNGFICDFNDSITLEQDLLRRDLTINAIAMDQDHHLIDPYNGICDLNNRILRHVSPAFQEDPLRVLRVARFAARFHHLGFTIAPETIDLMTRITNSGEIHHLTPERVWKETLKALATQNPQIYFATLRKCAALSILFPEFDRLFGMTKRSKHHSDIDIAEHTLRALKQSAQITEDLQVRFAVLCLHFGPTQEPLVNQSEDDDPKDLTKINQLCDRLKVPNHYKKMASLSCRYRDDIHNIKTLSAPKLLYLLNGIDVWRNPNHLDQIISSCIADYKGHIAFENRLYPQANFLKQAYLVAKSVPIQDIISAGFKGQAIQQQLINLRINTLIDWKRSNF